MQYKTVEVESSQSDDGIDDDDDDDDGAGRDMSEFFPDVVKNVVVRAVEVSSSSKLCSYHLPRRKRQYHNNKGM